MIALILAAALASAPADQSTSPTDAGAAPVTTTADATPAKPAKPKSDDPVVCRTQSMVNSRMKTRTCKHRSDWARQERDLQEYLRRRDAMGSVDTRVDPFNANN